MLIVCRTKAPRRGLTVTGSQHHRTRRVAMHEQTGHRRRPMPLWLAMAEMHSAVETESEVKKCSLTAIGKVSTPASRIQVVVRIQLPVPVECLGFVQQTGRDNA